MELKVFSIALIVSANLVGGIIASCATAEDNPDIQPKRRNVTGSAIAGSNASANDAAVDTEPAMPTAPAAVILRAVPQHSRVLLGKCEFNQPHAITLKIHNRSSMRLSLRQIDPDCGCLSVEPDRTLFEDGETLSLALKLAASQKLARVRRSVRVYFHEVAAPLLLTLDIDVIGPVHLQKDQFEFGSRSDSVTLEGVKEQAGLTLVSMVSGRGSFFVDNTWTQDERSFRCLIRPAIAFGSSVDSLRITYRDGQDKTHRVQLPLQVRITDPVRFLPSSIDLLPSEGRWFGKTRMVFANTDNLLSPKHVRFVSRQGDRILDPSPVRIAVEPVSTVLWTVFLTAEVSDDESRNGNVPDQVDALDHEGRRLGTLVLRNTD